MGYTGSKSAKTIEALREDAFASHELYLRSSGFYTYAKLNKFAQVHGF